MISPAHVQTMARYNQWQNTSLITAAEAIEPLARLEDRGGFWGGILPTLSHFLWADLIWMSRFDNWDRPMVTLGESAEMVTDWDSYCDLRASADADLIAWAEGLSEADLSGALTWYSGASGKEKSAEKWMLVTHMFNHQTHHRGQVHAMLTAAGHTPGDTDLFLMPGLSAPKTDG